MDRDQILAMDSYILLSLINTKLRDKFSSLDQLCDDYNISVNDIRSKLKSIGYCYNATLNKFINEDA